MKDLIGPMYYFKTQCSFFLQKCAVKKFFDVDDFDLLGMCFWSIDSIYDSIDAWPHPYTSRQTGRPSQLAACEHKCQPVVSMVFMML